jgi:Flp pilus assembly protein protease CpaA
MEHERISNRVIIMDGVVMAVVAEVAQLNRDISSLTNFTIRE